MTIMKYFFILACGFASLFSCSSDDPAEPVDTTKEPGYQKGTLEYLYFVEKGLSHPSKIVSRASASMLQQTTINY